MVVVAYDSASALTRRASALLEAVTSSLDQADVLDRAAKQIASRLRRGGTIYAIGNGGSAALAAHLTAELLGRLSRDRERPPVSAHCLCTDGAVLTEISESEGFARLFASQLYAVGRPQDVVVLFTTSGKSPNLVAAVDAAAALGMYRVALTGPRGTAMDACETAIHVGSNSPGTVQECHLLMLHALVEATEDAIADLVVGNQPGEVA